MDNDTGMVAFVGRPIKINGRLEGAVLLFSPLSEMEHVINQGYMLIFTTSLLFIIMTVIIIYFVSKKLTSPIAKMAIAARDIAQGSFGEDIKIETKDEMALLGDSFNYMKNRLKMIEKMRQDLISNISHELKTPITSIKGFVQGILDGIIEPTQEKAYLDIIMKESNRMAKLVGDLMELSKIQTGNVKLYKEEIKVKFLLDEAAKVFCVDLKQKQIDLTILPVDEDLKIFADKDRLTQVLINILSNAIKYTPEHGKIKIEAKEYRGKIFFEVSDTGIGMPEEEIPYIFEKFYRIRTPGKMSEGSGLGLAIAKEFIELHGGKIGAKSTPGIGTTIFFELPMR